MLDMFFLFWSFTAPKWPQKSIIAPLIVVVTRPDQAKFDVIAQCIQLC